jgi:hypothetical protein
MVVTIASCALLKVREMDEAMKRALDTYNGRLERQKIATSAWNYKYLVVGIDLWKNLGQIIVEIPFYQYHV